MAKQYKELKLRASDLERLGIQVAFVSYDDEATIQECKKNAQLIKKTFFSDPIPTSGPCLICGKHATELRGDGYGPGVFCCYGPGCIPF